MKKITRVGLTGLAGWAIIELITHAIYGLCRVIRESGFAKEINLDEVCLLSAILLLFIVGGVSLLELITWANTKDK